MTTHSIWRRSEVQRRFPVSSTTLDTMMREGRYPTSISLGERAVGWPAHEVDAVITAMIAGWPLEKIKTLVATLLIQRQENALEIERQMEEHR